MKKGKVFGKRQFIAAALVVCLAAAVWINMRYSSIDRYNAPKTDGNEEAGTTDFISAGNLPDEAVETSAGVNYISEARNKRNSARLETLEQIKAGISESTLSDEDKQKIYEVLSDSVKNSENEAAAETVIRSKGFDDALVIISEENITVIVPADELLGSETLQIQDAVTSVTGVSLEKIKIISVK